MTTRSTRSTRSAAPLERMTDGDVYVFLLQIAVLSWTTQQQQRKAAEAAAAAATRPGRSESAVKKPSDYATSSTTASPGSTSSKSDWMSLGGLMDLVGTSSREARFPEKLIKRLNDRLERIIKGQDLSHNDQTLRATVARFYGTFKEDGFQRQIKSNRKIEELILIFVTKAQETLKKGSPNQPPLSDDELKAELNKQVGQFIKINRECLDTIHGVSKELKERLDSYQAKLAPRPPPVATPSTASAAGGSTSSSSIPSAATTAVQSSRRGSAASSMTMAADPVRDSDLVRSVGQLFAVDMDQLSKDVDFMRKTCTEQAAMIDLKHCVKNINLQASWPGRREDFESEEAYQQWRTQELSALSQLMMQMCQANPELLKTTSGDAATTAPTRKNTGNGAAEGGSGTAPTEVSQAAEAGDKAPDAEALSQAVEDDEAFGNFTFIPPDPKAYYRRALELCIDFDLEKIKQQPEEEEVSLSILSRQHVDLLKECAQRWRLMAPFRTVSNLDVMRLKYERGEVPLDCISEALTTMQGTLSEVEAGSWAKTDHALLVRTCSALFDSFLRYIYEAFQDIHNVDPEEIAPYVAMTEELHESSLVRTNHDANGSVVEMERHVEELKDGIRIMAIHEYTAKTTELFSQAVDNEVVPLVQLLDWLEKGAKRLDKRYPQPLLGTIDPVCHVLEKQVPLFLDDLESMKHQIVQHATQEREPLAFEDIFALYRRVTELLKMHKAFCPDHGELQFSLADWFEPHIRHWLANTDKKTHEWVRNAIASDHFMPIDVDGAVHSSSIDDLFGALQQPVEFIQSLTWPNAYKNARFMTQLARSISKSIELYCHRVEELFMDEMFPRIAEGAGGVGSLGGGLEQKQSAWMVKAKQTLQGTQKVEPFHFQETSCVKLNNIEAARLLLDRLYTKIDADHQANVVREAAPDVPEKGGSQAPGQHQRYIFTIKIVLGENLQPIRDTGSKSRIDSFVTLSDERGNKIAKTRTIYETPDPRWDEAFDIPVDRSMWLAATVWDRKLVGDHALCGRAYLRLDPRYFGDFLAHELWLDLDTQGKLLARVSMEGEKDDILFYFGRAFRSLKRAESDMVRTIVDKMSVYIRQCLSRSVLRSIVRTSGINIDKALGNVKALYAQALAAGATATSSTAPTIPPIEAEAAAAAAASSKKQRPPQLTDQEIEGAISPLLDYLHECLGTLKSSLSDSQAELVMTKVWKEVLNTIDSILLPPLSDAPSDLSQLSGKEVEVVFKWLSFLRNFFNAYDEETGQAHGVPLEVLQGLPKYREIVAYTLYHDTSSDELMEACVREMQTRLRKAASAGGGFAGAGRLSSSGTGLGKTGLVKNKSVLQQRSLGTIKKRKQEKRGEHLAEEQDNLELILRLLRMRPHTGDFLQQQFATLTALQQPAGQQAQAQAQARGGPASGRGGRGGQQVPPLPSQPQRYPGGGGMPRRISGQGQPPLPGANGSYGQHQPTYRQP
ncbi:hypothetical protein BDZ90DRAFT_51811 [Jaminaea rosea]|uniref:Uncharacterized protein n=1 Tax=Jaminaea rosea TaxID=1569628 RepID=A0A316UT76_9BASI|nr:hypothetical protein BDZ90DRAFT_51811 [Jaminaea rosea]PWN26305.1 hypothetical protein BDZ90DRAFT_51811 [Jaminaea rosea]